MLEEGVGRALPGFYLGWVTVRHENSNRFACGSWIGVTIAKRPSRRNASGTYSPAVSRRAFRPATGSIASCQAKTAVLPRSTAAWNKSRVGT
jgi:hypothetical protein